MNENYTALDPNAIREFKRIKNDNFRIMSLYSRLLNDHPRAITEKLMSEPCEDGDDLTSAYVSILSYMFDIDDESESGRELLRRYILPSVSLKTTDAYYDNEYGKFVNFPNVKQNGWEIKRDVYLPYEAFPCGEIVCDEKYREYPQIAFFKERFSFPAVYQNGVEWMALKPNEIETMREPIENAHGNVISFGLGLGYYAFSVSQKQSVSTVTVVERDENVISLFEKYILPQIPSNKIKIVRADAFDYMKNEMKQSGADSVFVDIWHDTLDGLPLYLKTKKYESILPNATFDYWIERSIISRLRWIIFSEYTDKYIDSIIDGLPRIGSADSLREMLSNDAIAALAKSIRLKK